MSEEKSNTQLFHELPFMPQFDATELNQLTVAKLKTICREWELQTTGRKANIIEQRTHIVWNVIKAKQQQAQLDNTPITAEFWMKRLQELHDIHYEYKKRNRFCVDWDNYPCWYLILVIVLNPKTGH